MRPMAAHIRAGETHQRTLSADDEAAIMEAYADAPIAAETRVPACTTVQGSSSSAMMVALAMLGAILTIRRRR